MISFHAAVFGADSDLDASSMVAGREDRITMVSPELDFTGEFPGRQRHAARTLHRPGGQPMT